VTEICGAEVAIGAACAEGGAIGVTGVIAGAGEDAVGDALGAIGPPDGGVIDGATVDVGGAGSVDVGAASVDVVGGVELGTMDPAGSGGAGGAGVDDIRGGGGVAVVSVTVNCGRGCAGVVDVADGVKLAQASGSPRHGVVVVITIFGCQRSGGATRRGLAWDCNGAEEVIRKCAPTRTP